MNIAETAAAAGALVRRFDAISAAPFEGGSTVQAVRDELASIASGADAVRTQLGPLVPDGLDSFFTVQPGDVDQFASRVTTKGIPKGGNGDLEHLWRMRAGLATVHAAASAAAELHVEPGDAAAAGGLQAIDGASKLFVRSLLLDGEQQLGRADAMMAEYRFPGILRKSDRAEFVGAENARTKDLAAAIAGGVEGEVGHLLPEPAATRVHDAASKARYKFVYSGGVGNGARKVVVGEVRAALQGGRDALHEAAASSLDVAAGSAKRVLGGEVRTAARTIAGVLQDGPHLDALRAVLADPASDPAAVTAAMRELVATSVDLGGAFDVLRSGVPSQAMTDVTNRAARLSESLLAAVQSSPHAIVLPEATQELLSGGQRWIGLPIASRYAGLNEAFAAVDVAKGPPRMVADVLAMAKAADAQLAKIAPQAAALKERVPVDQLASRVSAVDDLLRGQEDAFWQVERVRGQQARPGVHVSVSAMQAGRLRTELAQQVAQAAETLLPVDAWRLPSDTLQATFRARQTLRELASTLLPTGAGSVVPRFTDATDQMARAAGGIEQLREQLTRPGAMDLVSLGDREVVAQRGITEALASLGAASATGEDYLAVGQALPDYSVGIAKAQAVVEQLEGAVPDEFLQPISKRIDAFARQVSAAENSVTPGYGRVLNEHLFPKRGDAAFIEQDLKVLDAVIGEAGTTETI